MGLRWKIVLALVTLAVLTTVAVGTIGFLTTRDRLGQEIDRSLATATATLRPRPGGIDLPQRGLLDIYEFQAVDRTGEVGGYPQSDLVEPGEEVMKVVDRPGLVAYETVSTPDGDVRIRSEGVRGGAVQVLRSLQETEAVLDDVRRRTVLLVVAVAVAAAAIGWIIAGSVAAPLARLTAVATDVERSGRLDATVPVRSNDEVGRLGTAFNRMLGALAASRADQRRLVEDAGHELRTPLTSVRTNVAVLRRHPDLDPAMRARVLDDLDAETTELVGLVEEVVALAGGSVDESPPERIELAAAVDAAAERARRRSGRDIVVVADASAVVAQRSAVERALSNLIDNALKFDATGGPIDIVVVGGRVEVADRGPGLGTEDEIALIFERFHRADEARAMPGSGLGLSIVRDVAERNGGGVTARNRDGGGAVVGFWLPPGPRIPS